MADHNASAATSPGPDYELDATLELREPEQYRALFEDTRKQIVGLLLDRAATTSELAQTLGKPKGTVGHHLKVLQDAGLIHVVRTERVRALEAKYYGRTARVFLYHREHEAVGEEARVLVEAAAEIAAVTSHELSANARYARIPADRADEWKRRLDDLIVEFADQPRGGDTTYALVYALYATSRPPLGATDDA